MAEGPRSPALDGVRQRFVDEPRDNAVRSAQTPPRQPRSSDRNSYPVIIVPGIMGTRLFDPVDQRRIWDPGLLGPPPALARLRDLTPLEPIDGGTDSLGVRHAAALYRNSYEALAHRLAPYNPVYAAGYDGRQDNRTSARRIGQIVDEALGQSDAGQVILVAHSMGGLVSRWFCRSAPQRVRALILLASPTHGTPQAFRQLKIGFGTNLPHFPADPERTFEFLFSSLNYRERITFLRTFPSVYQLMPTAAFCQQVPNWLAFQSAAAGGLRDSSDPVALYQNAQVGLMDLPTPDVQGNLAARAAFDRDLGTYMHPATYVLYGYGLATECLLDFAPLLPSVNFGPTVLGVRQRLTPPLAQSERFRMMMRPDPGNSGDGTVALLSGSAAGIPVLLRQGFAGVEHGAFPVHPLVMTEVERIIRSLGQARVPTQQPAVRAAPRAT
jgi:pimeloyl-ACP methyl ester carboxylesterase